MHGGATQYKQLHRVHHDNLASKARRVLLPSSTDLFTCCLTTPITIALPRLRHFSLTRRSYLC